MAGLTSYLTLTSRCGPPHGYYDEPDFLEDVWPFFLENSSEFESVYLFKNSYFGGQRYWQRRFGKQLGVTLKGRSEPQIIDLGPMTSLSPPLLDDLRHRSFYGGHLNVLYRTNTQGSLIARLCEFWPSPGTLNDKFENLGLANIERDFLLDFLSSVSEQHFLAAFGHDADPLYVFGNLRVLTRLAGREK